MKTIALFLLSMTAAFGQAPKTAPPETPEHKLLAAKLAALVHTADVCKRVKDGWLNNESEAKLKAIVDNDGELTATQKSAIKFNIHQGLFSHIPIPEEKINFLKAQVQSTDECTKTYRTTIDKKQSDLTVRETQAVKSCQALDLYPLDMTAKR